MNLLLKYWMGCLLKGKTMSYLNKIFCGSSVNMTKLPNASIDLIITSPPYNAQIEYDNYNDNQPLETFLELLQSVWKECFRVLKIGGRLCINVGNILRKPYIPLTAYTARACNEIGFIMRGEIIWFKSNMKNKTSTQWGSWKSPSNPCLYDAHEYIQIYSKQDPKIQHKGETDLTKKEFMEWTKGEWYFNTINTHQKLGHPVPFPEELPRRLIKLYSWIDDVVLDPFCGSGTTPYVAKMLKRKYVGYDLSPKYCKISKTRCSQTFLM